MKPRCENTPKKKIKPVSIDTSIDLMWREANCMQSPHYNRYIVSILTDSQSLQCWETSCDEFSTPAVNEDLWSAGWVVQIKEEAQEEICYRNVCEYQFHLWGIELLHHLTEFYFITFTLYSTPEGGFNRSRTESHFRGLWKILKRHKHTYFLSLSHTLWSLYSYSFWRISSNGNIYFFNLEA